MFATIDTNGKFTGVVYTELTQAVKDWHKQYGFDYIEITEPLVNIGTDEVPEYGIASQLQIQSAVITHFKSLYLGVVDAKLKELDYDSLATVKLWEGDAMFGAEATRILTWYKAIIAKNYELLNAGAILTDEEYLAQINGVVF